MFVQASLNVLVGGLGCWGHWLGAAAVLQDVPKDSGVPSGRPPPLGTFYGGNLYNVIYIQVTQWIDQTRLH